MDAARHPLLVAQGAFRILGQRATEAGQPGLALWTDAGLSALRRFNAEQAEATAAFHDALAVLDVPAGATKADLFKAIERANAKLRGALEGSGLAALAVVFILAAVSHTSDGDEMARRAGGRRGRSRRRDDIVELCDGETGEDLDGVLFFDAVGKHPIAEASA
jgi:hypothetical protein